MGFSHGPNDIRIFQKECSSLAGHGHQVFYVTSDKKLNIGEKKQGIEVIIVNLHKVNRVRRFILYCKEVKKILCSLNADVYHFHEELLLPVLLYMHRHKKKVIYDVHEDYPSPFFLRKFGKVPGRLLNEIVEIYEKYCIKRADYVIAATPHIRQWCKKSTSKVALVANYPVIHDRVDNKKPFTEREKILCYTGGISEINGIFNIMDAMQQIDGTLYLAGNLTESLKNELIKYPGWHKVKELGYISSEEVQNVQDKSRLGLVLYLPSNGTVEALPNKLFEYMEAGLPVIVSDFPLWKEIVERNSCGVCVPPDKPAEIAMAVNQILETPELGEKMGQNGRKAVLERYNWKMEENKLFEIYDKLQHGEIKKG